jgi:hypothetical protein
MLSYLIFSDVGLGSGELVLDLGILNPILQVKKLTCAEKSTQLVSGRVVIQTCVCLMPSYTSSYESLQVTHSPLPAPLPSHPNSEAAQALGSHPGHSPASSPVVEPHKACVCRSMALALERGWESWGVGGVSCCAPF